MSFSIGDTVVINKDHHTNCGIKAQLCKDQIVGVITTIEEFGKIRVTFFVEHSKILDFHTDEVSKYTETWFQRFKRKYIK
jgi:hypothetical protein